MPPYSYYQQYMLNTASVVPIEVDETFFTQVITTALDKQYDWLYLLLTKGYKEGEVVDVVATFSAAGWYDFDVWKEQTTRAACFLFGEKDNWTDLRQYIPTVASNWYTTKFP